MTPSIMLAMAVDRRQASPSLGPLFKNDEKHFWGQCADEGWLTKYSQTPAIYKDDFGQVTQGKSIKWGVIERNYQNLPFWSFGLVATVEWEVLRELVKGIIARQFRRFRVGLAR